MKTGFLTVFTMLASIAGMAVFAQPVIPSEAGEIAHVEGNVYLNGQRVQPSTPDFPKITENSLMRTERGRAEVWLAPGAALRLGENSSFRMIAIHPNDTRIELLTG